jgi:hypothetical protein
MSRLALLASALLALAACASPAADLRAEDTGGADLPDAAAQEDAAALPDVPPEDAAEPTPDATPDAAPDAEAGLPVMEQAWRLDSLDIVKPSGPAALLEALVRPNIADSSLNVLFAIRDLSAPVAPATGQLRVDAALLVEAGVYRFDPGAIGVPGPAQIDAEGALSTSIPLPRLDFPVATGQGEEARVLFLLPIRDVQITARLEGGALTGGSLAGLIVDADAEATEVPLNGETFPLSNLLGFKDVDLDGDEVPDAWQVEVGFSAAGVRVVE